MIARLLLFLLLIAPGVALAQSDSPTTALAAVDDFHNSAVSVTVDLPKGAASMDFISGSEVIYRLSVTKLKSLRSTMEPSQRRHRLAVDLFEKYCDAQTGLLKPLAKASSVTDAEKIAAKEAELKKMREAKVESFNDALKHETYKPIKPTPMPETNRPPYDKEHEHKGGVFDR